MQLSYGVKLHRAFHGSRSKMLLHSMSMKNSTVTNRNLQNEYLELPTQAALISLGLFKGQMATPVLQKIASNNIQLVKVLLNSTHMYQPLDVTVNGMDCQTVYEKKVCRLVR